MTFQADAGPVRALDGVDLDVMYGDRLAIIGESGCGKSVLGHASMRLLDDIATVTGQVNFRGRDLYRMDPSMLISLRGREISLIPQNPSSSFNPVIKIGAQIQELIEKSGVAHGASARKRVLDCLARAGFSDPRPIFDSYPHRLSGGMCQRALIAMAISAEPELIIADEPTKGLDGPTKKSVLALLMEVSEDAALIMITHDLKATSVCEKMVVMYSGEIVEEGATSDLLGAPGHPYLRCLLDAQPSRGMKPIGGENRMMLTDVIGCRFKGRCEAAAMICSEHPDLRYICHTHKVRCHFSHGGGV